MFTQKFGRYVCDGDSIKCEVDGFECTAFTERDDDGSPPDQRMEGFWPSLDPKDPGHIGPRSKSTLRRHMARARAVMKAWELDEWDYCGVCVTVSRHGVPLTGKYDNALWGVERNYPGSDNDDLREVANDLLGDALDEARANLAQLCEAAPAGTTFRQL